MFLSSGSLHCVSQFWLTVLHCLGFSVDFHFSKTPSLASAARRLSAFHLHSTQENKDLLPGMAGGAPSATIAIQKVYSIRSLGVSALLTSIWHKEKTWQEHRLPQHLPQSASEAPPSWLAGKGQAGQLPVLQEELKGSKFWLSCRLPPSCR